MTSTRLFPCLSCGEPTMAFPDDRCKECRNRDERGNLPQEWRDAADKEWHEAQRERS